MRLLNIETFKLESYDDEWTIPRYVILSHTWEKEEVLFKDLQELPRDQEIQDLRRNFKDLEQRFSDLQRQLDSKKHGSEKSTVCRCSARGFCGLMAQGRERRGWQKRFKVVRFAFKSRESEGKRLE